MANNHKIIHTYKYLTLKATTIKEDIKFNKKCLSLNITPNYVQIQTKSKSRAALKALETARKIWIKEEINTLYAKLNTINNKLGIIYPKLTQEHHSETLEEILQYIHNWIKPILLRKQETHLKKLTKLKDLKNNEVTITELDIHTICHPTVQNLTDIKFESEENNMISKSLKYNINLDDKTFTIIDDLININVAITNNSKDTQEALKHNFIHELEKTNLQMRKHKTNQQTNKDMNLIHSISSKLSLNNAIITKADKGNTVVIISTQDYNMKVNKFINDNKFKMLHKNPIHDYSKTTNSIISKCKTLTKIEQNQLKMTNPKAPTLRGQPKIHKESIPIRPIVNFRNAPTYKVCKFLNYKIKRNIDWEENYTIKNTIELVNQIKEKEIPNNTIFISFDINNMYSNIPVNETLQILKEELTKNKKLKKNEVEDIMKLSKTTINQNFFEFNSNYYKQEDGLAMGSPLSGLLADIFMHDLETKKIMNITNPFKDKIIYWYRYVDDILCLFKGNEEEGNKLLKYLNSISKQIKFTSEIQNHKINFLDITISKENNIHSFKIFRKPTQTDLIIPSTSNHPWNHKIAAFHSMINRLHNIPMNKINFDNELKTIKYIASVNGYNPNMINNMIKLKLDKHKNTNIKKEEEKKYICIPHNTTMNRAIRKTFQHTQFKLSYRTRNNSFNLIKKLTKSEPKLNNDFDRSGVYKIKCSDCESYYIGQTRRTFRSRFKEHIQALRTQNKTSMKSNFAEHLIQTNHNYKNIEENMTILNYENKSDKLNSKEELQIYLNYNNNPDKILNTMQVHNRNPIFDKIMKLTMKQ